MITLFEVGSWSPTFDFNFISLLVSVDKVLLIVRSSTSDCVSSLILQNNYWRWEQKIMDNTSLSSVTMHCDSDLSLCPLTFWVSGLEKESSFSLGCFSVTYSSLGWGASSHDRSIAYLLNSANMIIIFRCKQMTSCVVSSVDPWEMRWCDANNRSALNMIIFL